MSEKWCTRGVFCLNEQPSTDHWCISILSRIFKCLAVHLNKSLMANLKPLVTIFPLCSLPPPNMMNNNEHLCWPDPLCNISLFHLRMSGWLQQEHRATCMELFLMSFVSGTFKVQEPQRCSLITPWFFWEKKTMMNVCCLSSPQHLFPPSMLQSRTLNLVPLKKLFFQCDIVGCSSSFLFSVKALCHCSLCRSVSAQHFTVPGFTVLYKTAVFVELSHLSRHVHKNKDNI